MISANDRLPNPFLLDNGRLEVVYISQPEAASVYRYLDIMDFLVTDSHL